MKPIPQEAPMGCAIACVASFLSLSYKETRKLFKDGKTREYTTGFYNRDILKTLKKRGIVAKAHNFNKTHNKKLKPGIIVFVERSNKYPAGHYLLKTKKGWMNPWINFPIINPAKAGFQKKLPGRARWIIEILQIQI